MNNSNQTSNKILEEYVNINDESGEIIFEVKKTGNSYSKICSNIHEQKLFTKFFESRNISISQRGKLNKILNNKFQVKPLFKDSTPSSMVNFKAY